MGGRSLAGSASAGAGGATRLPKRHAFWLVNFECVMGTATFSSLLAAGLAQALEERLDILSGEITPDGLFSIGESECLGSCGTAPVLQVNNEPFVENLKPADLPALLERLRARAAASGSNGSNGSGGGR